ncbi:MAG: hypothetical protein M3Q16_06545, partial [Pseudomonadota bacterium]|nr:hypothetical protein [Pseudomonadota bacterium]
MVLSQSVKRSNSLTGPLNNDMGFFSSLSADHLQRYSRIIQEGIAVRQHSDLLRWLQGEVQH